MTLVGEKQLLTRGFLKEDKGPFYKRPIGILLISMLIFACVVLVMKNIGLLEHNKAENADNQVITSFTTTTTATTTAREQEYIDPENYMEVLSWSPRIFKFKNFATPEECDTLIQMANDRLKLSTLYAGEGNFNDAKTRSSKDMFFGPDETKWLDERIARATRIPASHGESLTVIHYDEQQQYLPHFDYFQYGEDAATDNLLNTYGNRLATFIVYLNDMDEDAGGTTSFPHAAAGRVSVRPRKGDATFFYNMSPDGAVDPSSLHTGSPVLKGEKWIATKWIRQKKWKQEDDYVPTFGTKAT